MKRILTLLLAVLAMSAAKAQTDDPRHPIFHKTQPDGSSLRVRMYGGAHADYVFYTTTDSVALVWDAARGYCYARPENGRLVSTGIAAHEASSRSDDEQAVADSTPRLHEALQTLQSRAVRRRIAQPNRLTAVSSDGIGLYGRTLGGKVNSIGEYTLPVVLVQFADREFNATSTDEKFTRWLNAENYTEDGSAGSVRQYFVDQSRGMFTPNFDVVARITLDSSYVHYGKDDGDAHDVNLISIFLSEVFQTLKKQGINLSKYQDSRTDNCIPLVAILYAGTGQAQSGEANDIWPCELDLGSDYTYYTGGYRVNSVFFGNEWAYGKMNGLGTFCHEFSHAMGLPDIYATNYDHSKPMTGQWSIMESGCYVEGGYRPIDYTAHEKNQLGWLRLKEPTETHVYTLYPMDDDREPHALLLRNPENDAEYYILENRQPGRWTPESFGKGLLAMHIDYNSTNWSQNNVNNDENHLRTLVVPADGNLSSDASDLYPTSSNRMLHDKSNPATKVYTGSGLKRPVYTIRANKDRTVTLSYGSASAPAYFVGDTVYVSSSKLTCLVSASKELTVIAADGGYSGNIVIPDDSVYFDHTRYKYVAVGSDAFANCPQLTSVQIGNCVRSVEAGAFRNSPNLQAITVSENNVYLEAKDGALYTLRPSDTTSEPTDAQIDFTANAQDLPTSATLRDYETGRFPTTYTEQKLSMRLTDGTDHPAFLWNTASGIRLRISKDATLTLEAPTGYNITAVSFTANSLYLQSDLGTISSRKWTGNATPKIVFTATSASTISSITATIERDASAILLVATPQNQSGTFSLPDSVTMIMPYAMSGAAYTTVEIPASVTTIGGDALSMTGLQRIDVFADVPPTCTADAFTLVPDVCTLHIPQGTLALYKAAPYWERFFPRMEEDLQTAIILRTGHPVPETGETYDLQGRRVTVTPQHGVYIRDGKKTVF